MKTSKIAIYAPNLARGGIELICFNLVNEMSKQVAVDVIGHNSRIFDGVANKDNLNFVTLKRRRKRSPLINSVQLAWELRGYLQTARPTKLLTFKSPLSAVLARALSNHKPMLFIRESNSPAALRGAPPTRFLKRLIKRVVYSKADWIIALCQDMATALTAQMGASPHKIKVIYNPTVSDGLKELAREQVKEPFFNEPQAPVIVSVGRFDEQKDFKTLIDAFAAALKRRPCRLALIGDGRLANQIKALIESHGIQKHVFLPGFASNPYKYIAKSAMFALSSRYEGLANALIEAQACGAPTIATDCPTSPREILLDGRAGLLVEPGDSAALADAIVLYLTDAELRAERAKTATANLSRFDAAQNAQKYLEFLQTPAL